MLRRLLLVLRRCARAAVLLLTLAGMLTAAGAGAAAPAATGHRLAGLGIRHVFVIVLENESYQSTYVNNPHPYLGRTLQRQGTLLTHYFATGHLSNDNYLSMISGQAPNVATQSDCQDYVDFQPSPAVLDSHGQAVGTGCVYPANVKTLPDQLQARHVSWHGYMEDMGNDLSREPSRCGEPTSSFGSGMPDGTQSATAKDQYAARHNPFVYFHSLIDSGSCHRNVVPLAHLAVDLHKARTTPDFSFITPNLCDDGHDGPCTGKDSRGSKAGGLTSVDHFLSTWVPRIERSPAFRRNGLLVITSDESDTGDTSSCCAEQPGPGSPFPGAASGNGPGAGGGRIGTLLIGRCVRAGAKDPRPYNHYSLLRSLEDLYGITRGGSDHKGHLGFAGVAGPKSFGSDVFAACPASASHRSSSSASGGSAPPAAAHRTRTSSADTAALASTGGLPLAAGGAVLLAAGLLSWLIVTRRSRRSPRCHR